MARILVVDDDTDLAYHIANSLNEEGFQTGVATNGVEAVIKIMKEQWYAVVMDIRMPELDGIGALKIIKSVDENLPVVLLSSHVTQADMAKSVREGAFAVLSKPVKEGKLVEILNSFIRNSASVS